VADVEFAWIYNAAIDGVAFQPAAAFPDLWAKKGFVLVDLDLSEASDTLGFPVTLARQLPEDYVRAVASRPVPAPPPFESRSTSLDETVDPPPKAAPARRSTTAKEA
jgi:hypothetical protein